MKSLRTFSALVALILLISFLSTVRADDFDGDDLNGGGSVKPLTWEPMIVELYAIEPHGQSAVVSKPQDPNAIPSDMLGEKNQWAALKAMILPKGTLEAGIPAVDPAASVISAWQRIVTPDGQVEFRVYSSAGSDGNSKIHAIYAKEHDIVLSLNLDILCNVDDAQQRDKMIRDNFQIAELHISAIKISDDPTKFRDALPASPDPKTAPARALFDLGKEEDTTGRSFADLAHSFAHDSGGSLGFSPLQAFGSETGVFEFRVMARVLGRANSQDPSESKKVEGAIRVAFVNNKALSVEKLSYDTTKQNASAPKKP